jgi:hypothetical protein
MWMKKLGYQSAWKGVVKRLMLVGSGSRRESCDCLMVLEEKEKIVWGEEGWNVIGREGSDGEEKRKVGAG